MVRRAAHIAVVVSLALLSGGCAGHAAGTPADQVSPADLGATLYCTRWSDTYEKEYAGLIETWEARPGNIGVIIHIMLAIIDQAQRGKYQEKYHIDRAWVVAPVEDAAKKHLTNVVVGEPATEVEYWTPRTIRAVLGKVNEIWKEYGIHLILLAGEDCPYYPSVLRPDELERDSILTPQTSTPWTGQLFRSINRFLVAGVPNVLHVVLWWSVAETDIDDIDVVAGGLVTNSRISGYSRSSARGGPVVWVGTYDCLTVARSLASASQGRCAKVIAHEVGHALGLHHVEWPDTNLMYLNPFEGYVSENERGAALSKRQQEQAAEEAREQFGSQ